MKNAGMAGAVALVGIGLITIGLGNFVKAPQAIAAAPAVVSVAPGFYKKRAPLLRSSASASTALPLATSAEGGVLTAGPGGTPVDIGELVRELGLTGARYRLYQGFGVSEEVSPWWRFVLPPR